MKVKLNILKIVITAFLFLSFSKQAEAQIYSTSEAVYHLEEYAKVKGTVYEVYISRKGTIFLDIDGNYPNNPFSGVIFNSYAPNFTNVKKYEGKEVVISGKIKKYKGKAEIIITTPKQIKIIEKE